MKSAHENDEVERTQVGGKQRSCKVLYKSNTHIHVLTTHISRMN